MGGEAHVLSLPSLQIKVQYVLDCSSHLYLPYILVAGVMFSV